MPGPSSQARTLTLVNRVDHLDALAREPMIVEHPDGTLFVSGYGEPGPKLWKSQDHGSTWARVNVGSESDGAIGNSDVDLAITRDGTLYFVTMGFDRKVLEGTHIAVGVTKDVGATWRWTMLSKVRFDDRPWVAVASDGTAHVIWNDGGGVCHSVSQDGGLTWTERPRIHPKGGSSHLAVGPNKEVAVRITPASASGNRFDEGVDLIAISTDGGNAWETHPAPGQRDWSSNDKTTPRWVEPLAWDPRGALYSLWGAKDGLWLARSEDHGGNWSIWHVVESSEVAYFPYLVARSAGELAATWFSGEGESLQAHVARLEVRDSKTPPRVIQSQPFQPDTWTRNWNNQPDFVRTRDSGGEYLAVVFLASGGLAVVSPIQNQIEKRFGFTWWRFEER